MYQVHHEKSIIFGIAQLQNILFLFDENWL